jgi:hypothetical protein
VTTITIPTKIDRATAKSTARYALRDVEVTSDGESAVAWATDGRMLAVVNCSADNLPAGKHTLPGPCLPTSKKRRTISVEVEGGIVVAGADAKTGEPVEVEPQSFPGFLDVIPTADGVSKAHTTLSIGALRKMIDAVANTSPDHPNQRNIHIMIGAPGHPVAFMTSDALGVLMPAVKTQGLLATYEDRRRETLEHLASTTAHSH